MWRMSLRHIVVCTMVAAESKNRSAKAGIEETG